MSTPEEVRLQRELAEQKEESEKWFAKIQRINAIVQEARRKPVYVGGSKPQGFPGSSPAPSAARPLTPAKAIEQINAVLHGER
jgi:hypothetical protein